MNVLARVLPDVPYEITVYTSDMMGSGTSANVYIVLYGCDGATEEVILADTSKKKKDSFKRGSVDQFVKEVSEFVDAFSVMEWKRKIYKIST